MNRVFPTNNISSSIDSIIGRKVYKTASGDGNTNILLDEALKAQMILFLGLILKLVSLDLHDVILILSDVS